MEARAPIVVDLDGTLTLSDTVLESLVKLVKQSPLNLLRLPLWLLKGRAGFKDSVASHVNISAEYLPYHKPLLIYLSNEKEMGRRIILATAAHKSIAERVSAHLGLFDEVLATDLGRNLKGKTKLEAILKRLGGEFVYAGDSQADIPIWKAAKAAILVGVAPDIAEAIRQDVPVEQEFLKENVGFTVWLRALRVHQWLKNLLLFVPLLTAFSFLEIGKLATMTVAFLVFSFAASATYIVNDLWDLENDRAHPRKRLRPFASAQIPILQGLSVAAIVLILAFVIAFAVSKGFFLMFVVVQ